MAQWYEKYCFLTFLLLLFSVSLSSQIIGKPKLGFEYACAKKGGFNSFKVSVAYSGYSDANNYFILELSDPQGDFTDASKVKELKRVKGSSGSSTLNFEFSFPEGVFGEQYKVRVRSTSPIKQSSLSKEFSAYLLPPDRPMLNNGKREVFMCGNNPQREIKITYKDKSIDPSVYKYRWFKNNKVFKEGGSTLVVTEKGSYYAEVLLQKACTNIDPSNLVEAKIVGGVGDFYVNDKEVVAEICSNESYTFKANLLDKEYEYRWFKNDTIIQNSSLYLPELTIKNDNPFGVYYLEVTTKNRCVIKSQKITLKQREADFEVSIEGGLKRGIVPNQTIDLQSKISKKSTSYVYQWYKNDEPISGEEDSVLTVVESGAYFLEVAENIGGCSLKVNSPVIKVEKENTATVVPNILTPFNGDGVNDFWEIPKPYANNPNVKIIIFEATGKQILVTSNYQNNWPEEGKVKAGMLYYYRIFEGGQVKKSGTISVIE